VLLATSIFDLMVNFMQWCRQMSIQGHNVKVSFSKQKMGDFKQVTVLATKQKRGATGSATF
jgi:hypothetical protein